jgi:hypothetical protein
MEVPERPSRVIGVLKSTAESPGDEPLEDQVCRGPDDAKPGEQEG